AEDIRAINERTLRQEEDDANQRAHADILHNATSVLSLQTGDGRQTLSWIWYHVTTEEIENDADGSLNDGIRLEWLKARARARRWREEVILVEEEMRRALAYTLWRVEWWKAQAEKRTDVSPMLREGLIGYAAEQAETERVRASTWEMRWAPVRQRASEALQDQLTVFNDIEIELENEEEDEDNWSEED
ncbi:hypothetical protein H0H92_013149, partial [Tricholoma furcatifolium]